MDFCRASLLFLQSNEAQGKHLLRSLNEIYRSSSVWFLACVFPFRFHYCQMVSSDSYNLYTKILEEKIQTDRYHWLVTSAQSCVKRYYFLVHLFYKSIVYHDLSSPTLPLVIVPKASAYRPRAIRAKHKSHHSTPKAASHLALSRSEGWRFRR